jgi:predicted aspartyl protease
MRRALCLAGLLALTTLPTCERWRDPRQALRKATGGQPLNQIKAYGRGPMPFNRLLNLPQCDALLNNRVPCRLMLDTGAGDLLILGPEVAEQLNLAPVADMQVSGVGGTSAGNLALLDELAIGDIRVERVTTFLAHERSPLMMIAEGVIGTGVLGAGRVSLDFEHGELVLSPSSAAAGAGSEVTIHVGDSAHIFTSVLLQSLPASALLDSGASRLVLSPKWLEENYSDHPNLTLDLPLPQFALGVDMATPLVTTCADLEFAGRRIENVVGYALRDIDDVMSQRMGETIDLVIGMTIFCDMNSWTVDFPQRRMWVDWLDEP